MHLEFLEARDFRNLKHVRLELSPGFVVFEGQNAQGKTNILEALYVCATGKSFRHSSPSELVHWEREGAFLRAGFLRQGVRHDIEVKLGQRRTVQVDGRALRGTSKLLEMLNVISFFPDDLRIIKGSPEERRRFVDRAIANHSPKFVQSTSAYTHALKSKNALLRQGKKPGARLDPTLLDVYDTQLAEHGAVIHHQRLGFLRHLLPMARERFSDIMEVGEAGEGPAYRLGLHMHDGFGQPCEICLGNTSEQEHSEPKSPGDFQAVFLEGFQWGRAKDIARGLTGVGPHRGDLICSIDGHDARQFASQGQQRAIILALKLAEMRALEERLGTPPILLLDDVSSELDRLRSARLFEALSAHAGQVLISTTGAADLPLKPQKDRPLQRFGVHAGEVRILP